MENQDVVCLQQILTIILVMTKDVTSGIIEMAENEDVVFDLFLYRNCRVFVSFSFQGAARMHKVRSYCERYLCLLCNVLRSIW